MIDSIGLCRRCAHHRAIGNRRGSTFHLCGLSRTDPRYSRYPRLPVVTCSGYAPGREDANGNEREETTDG